MVGFKSLTARSTKSLPAPSTPSSLFSRACYTIPSVRKRESKRAQSADCSKFETPFHLGLLCPTTRWYRLHGRPTKRERAAKQQYLSPREEEILVKYLLRMSERHFPVPAKFLHPLARTIR